VPLGNSPTTSVDPLANPTGALAIPGPPQRNLDPRTQALQTASPGPQRPAQNDLQVAVPPQLAGEAEEPHTVNRPLLKMRELQQRAADRYGRVPSYTMRLRRREVVAGKAKPEELLLVKFRKQPYSVHFQWVGPEAEGREVIYVQGQHGDVIHTLTAKGDVPLMPAGQVFKVSPNSALVRGRSRYPITEAGVGPLIERFARLADAVEKGLVNADSIRDLGQLRRPEFENKVDGIEQAVETGSDPTLPGGGRRLWFFDSVHHLPSLVITYDEMGREVEYYCHDQFDLAARLEDRDFDPAKLWRR
jgi:hypothetical protein